MSRRESTYTAVIAALPETARARSMYGTPLLLDGVLNHCREVLAAANVSHVTVASSDAGVLRRAESLGMAVEEVSAEITVDDLWKRGDGRIILAPHRGPVGLIRLRCAMDLAHDQRRATISSMQVSHNCHPGWLHGVDLEHIDGPMAVEPDFRKKLALELAPETRLELGLNGDRIKGSQWLPPLNYPDGGIVVVPEGAEIDSLGQVCDCLDEYADIPLFYSLPIYQLNEDIPFELPLDVDRATNLFMPFGAYPRGDEQ